MGLDDQTMRSRRAILGAGAGAIVATVASAVVHPDLVRAGSDGDVVLDAINDASGVTWINKTNSSAPGAFRADCLAGAAIHGTSQGGTAILGEHLSGNQPGVTGISYQTGPGVVGWSELGSALTATPSSYPAYTGVFGGASEENGPDPHCRGVHGRVQGGQGVRGEATTGVGIYATATTGTALQVSGKASFSRSGRATIASGHSYVDVTVAGGLAGTPLCFANLQTFRSGISVAAVRPNYPSAGKLRIYLSKAVTASTYVAWIVTN